MSRTYQVTAQWDPEASVWVATSDDIPGLVSESSSLDTLVERVAAVGPELLEANGEEPPATDPHDWLDFRILAQFPPDLARAS